MADGAVLGEAGGGMVGIGRLVVGGQMAGGAVGRQAGKPIADVALLAGGRGMRSRQGELGGGIVVEFSAFPLRGRVAGRAILGKAGRHVIGILGVVECRQVATDAGGRRSPEEVVLMTLGASDCRVRSGERELGGGVMVELGSLPLRRGVAQRAVLREAGQDVIGIPGALERRQVAGNAGAGGSAEDIVLVALGADYRRVRSGQGKLRGGIVVKFGPLPLRGAVAQRAVLREAGHHVIGIAGVVECGEMAGDTSAGRPSEDVVGMALGAADRGVRPGQRKLGARGVVELSPLPLRRGVAQRAILREAGRDMIGVARVVEAAQVTGDAGGGGSGKLVVLVAQRAGCGGVGSGQGKMSGRVVIELRARPLSCRVAHGAKLGEPGENVIRIGRFVEIGEVAGDAGSVQAGKLIADMASLTVDVGMRSGQGKPGAGVIELGAFPLCRGVTDPAVLGKSRRGMIGVARVIERAQVTGDASGGGPGKLVVFVALSAGRGRVGSSQGKLCGCIMIKLGARPLSRGVADGAFLGKAGGSVVGIGRFVEVGEMTGDTACVQAGELIVDVASLAVDASMRAGQRELGTGVVVRCPRPLRGCVARAAILREPRSRMIGAAGVVKGRQVAGGAKRRRSGKLIILVA